MTEAPGQSEIDPFWRTKSLSEMTLEEWESLCDGCGKCCLHKLQDAETDELFPTNVACRLLDVGTCRCSDYPNRKIKVPDCVQLAPETAGSLPWLPQTCAYRLLAEGEDLPAWHPLVSGDRKVYTRLVSRCGAAPSQNGTPALSSAIWLIGRTSSRQD